MSNSAKEFWKQVDEIYGTFLDSSASYHAFRERICNLQSTASVQLKKSVEELDKSHWIYGKGAPTDPGAQEQHVITQGELKERLEKNGHNTLFLAKLCVVAIYQYWEDHYRPKIAADLGSHPADLKSDLMGDIRQIRIAIVHHGGIAKTDIEKCKILQWFKAGDAINIDEGRMHEIILQIRKACDEWLKQCKSQSGA